MAPPESLAAADPIYCREQIKIPPAFPDILKNYSKFIIKNQPDDIVAASADYFNNLARQQDLGRQVHVSSISREQLETLYLKMSAKSANLSREAICKIADDAIIPLQAIDEVFKVGSWPNEGSIAWTEFWALCCTVAAGTVEATLHLIVEILTNNGTLPSATLAQAAKYLAKVEGSVGQDKLALALAELTMDGDMIAEPKAMDILRKMFA
ncbi:hypothetical protein H9P43_001470 [Blastocladiella emersonii ATCC 22665]|nr:hypothetical protein H9P43_001470 [Blastocladiella emersonii ATCC 22665]